MLSQTEVDAFARDGFLIVRGLAAPALRERMLAITLDGMSRGIEPLELEADLHYPGAPDSREAIGGRTIRRLKQALSRDYCFLEWVTSPAVSSRIRQLLGSRDVLMPLAHHNCVMTKQPEHSSDTGWHQDIRYWSYVRPDLVSMWTALTDENLANGCLHVIPGSHRQIFDRSRFDAELFFRDDLPENTALIARQVAVELQPGDTLFFHARTLHAASRNHSRLPKLSVVFTFRPADNPPLAGSRSSSSGELLLSAPAG